MPATIGRIPSLLEVCSFHFEKNEVIDGWATPRDVPMPTSKLAQDAFDHLCVESSGPFRIGVSGRLVGVMVARPRFPEILYGDSDWESLDEHQNRLEALWEP